MRRRPSLACVCRNHLHLFTYHAYLHWRYRVGRGDTAKALYSASLKSSKRTPPSSVLPIPNITPHLPHSPLLVPRSFPRVSPRYLSYEKCGKESFCKSQFLEKQTCLGQYTAHPPALLTARQVASQDSDSAGAPVAPTNGPL